MSSPLASIDLPTMDLSSSIFDFDFGAVCDDFGVEVFDDFDADFERAFDFDFLGTAFDAGFDSTVEDSVTAKFDDVSIGDWSGGSGRSCQRRRVWRSNRVYRIKSVTESAWFRYFTRPGMTLAGNVGVVSRIFPPQNDRHAAMLAPCRQHDTDHVGDITP
jgi:hypothetical protein